MFKRVKLKNNNYLGTESIVHGRKRLNNLIDNINTGLQRVGGNSLGARTDTDEHIVLTKTVAKAGQYLLIGNACLNYYGAVGRELYLYLKVNGVLQAVGGGIINESTYGLYTPMIALADIRANSTVTISVKNTVAEKFYALTDSSLQLIRLK